MRDEEIREILQEELLSRAENSKQKIQEEYEKNREKYILSFLNSLDKLFVKCKFMQEQKSGDKNSLGNINYIWINCMRASVETESYKYVLRAYDETMFLCEAAAFEEYVSEYQLPMIADDKKYIESIMMKKIIRAKKYEVKDLQKWYEWNTYMKEMPREMEDAIERIPDLKSYQDMKKEVDVKVCYGEMLEIQEKEYIL